MTSSPGTPAPARSLVERLLRPVAEVRAGEGAVVLLMALNLFLVLSAYYMLKTVREALILTEVSAAVKTYASAGQALLLLVLVPAFGAFASRVNRLKLLTWVTVFFVANIVVFFLLGRTGVAPRGRLLHLGGHLQRDGDLPVLGLRQRHLHPRAGQAPPRGGRRGQQPGGLGGLGVRRAASAGWWGPTT